MDSTLKTVSGDFNSGTIFKPVTGKENPIEVIASIKKAYASMGHSPAISTVIFIAALGALALDDSLDRIVDPRYPTDRRTDLEPQNYYETSGDYSSQSHNKGLKQISKSEFITLYHSVNTHCNHLQKIIKTYRKSTNFSIIETRLKHANIYIGTLTELYRTADLDLSDDD